MSEEEKKKAEDPTISLNAEIVKLKSQKDILLKIIDTMGRIMDNDGLKFLNISHNVQRELNDAGIVTS